MKKYFGGSHLNKKRKSKRPLDFDKPIHLILRLKDNLPGLFFPRDKHLRQGFYKIANKYDVKICDLVLNHSHVHLAILINDRKSYTAFIRELTSRIVAYFSKIVGIKLKNIFMQRPFTRLVSWGRGTMILYNYLKKNEKESGHSQIEPKQSILKMAFNYIKNPSLDRQLILFTDSDSVY